MDRKRSSNIGETFQMRKLLTQAIKRNFEETDNEVEEPLPALPFQKKQKSIINTFKKRTDYR